MEGQQALAYIVSKQGAVRFSCIILNFCAGVSMSSSWWRLSSRGQFFNFTAWTGFLCSLLAFTLHMLQVHQRPAFRSYPLHIVETVYSVLWAFFYLVASSCVADWSFLVDSSWKASAAFGFISCLIYIVLSYWCWLAVRQGSDTVDNAYSVYDTTGSYQNSQPGFGSRPGQNLVASESGLPTVTITSHSTSARLELVD